MAKGETPKLKEMPDMAEIKEHIQERLEKVKKIEKYDAKVEKEKVGDIAKEKKVPKTELKRLIKQEWVKTGVPGFDDLTEFGIPKGASILVAGGCGTGKTIFCLQTLAYAAAQGEKCLYLSFEEHEDRLKQHMEDFGWDWKKLEQKGNLKIVKQDPFEVATAVEAMLAEAKGELLIDIKDAISIVPKGFKPNRVVIDSLSAVAAAFAGKEEEYRIYIEQLFEYFRTMNITTFFISETEQVPAAYSKTGIEEFLADGVVVMYGIKKGDIRITALEFLKMRGAKIKKKIVPFQIISEKGIEVHPEETVFAEI